MAYEGTGAVPTVLGRGGSMMGRAHVRARRIRQEREDHAAIKHALGEELMPDDLAGLQERFIVKLMGAEKAKEYFLREHQEYVRVRRGMWRAPGCVLFGCKPQDGCDYETCEMCAGACSRCQRPVLAKATLR